MEATKGLTGFPPQIPEHVIRDLVQGQIRALKPLNQDQLLVFLRLIGDAREGETIRAWLNRQEKVKELYLIELPCLKQ